MVNQLTVSDLLNTLVPRTIENVANGLNITSGAGAKGSWVQADASVAKPTIGLVIELTYYRTTGASEIQTGTMMVDIGTGAGGAEVVLIADLLYDVYAVGSGRSAELTSIAFYFPVQISSGTRIAVRCQSSTGNADLIDVSIWELQRS